MLPKAALTRFLRSLNPMFYAHLQELRTSVSKWLEYVPATFPHYTRHGVSHSDEIIIELSQLMFQNGDESAPVIPLSPAEVYILCAAAYLHDTGMVVADREKIEILGSEPWKHWTGPGGGGAKRWAEIQQLRAASTPDPAIRTFVADLQTRHLIAEFVRRIHHLRVKTVLASHPELAQCGLNDTALLRAITDVCAAHGLAKHDLEDNQRYPERRTIRGEQVNLRFLAMLLRIGDLLDMTSERACSMLLAAASPLPVDSLSHWSQYKRIVHRLTAPDRIELTAECETQEEHSLLQDWCTWLQSEIHTAQVVMARSSRHSEWTAPHIRLEDPGATIRIRPAADARYRPSKWIFELDAPTVMERLIKDAYQYPEAFIRELLQNALDATRTQIYSRLRETGEGRPRSPTDVSEHLRAQYPINIRIEDIALTNPLSGEQESRQVFTIDDLGTGMDSNVITRFLLQIGRSFYTSAEFLDHYPFVPTSRFGIGFLSVFAVSDHVEIETLRPSSTDGAIKLTLVGPRSYLLTETGTRRSAGTSVSVQMKKRLSEQSIEQLLRHWCKRVEVPVVLERAAAVTTILPEAAHQTQFDVPTSDSGATTVGVSIYPLRGPDLEGDVCIAWLRDGRGESWADRYAIQELVKAHPQIGRTVTPASWIALHGINMTHPKYMEWEESDVSMRNDSLYVRADIRGPAGFVSLSRSGMAMDLMHNEDFLRTLEGTYAPLLTRHLAECTHAHGENGWRYRQRLANEFPLPSHWDTVSEMILCYARGTELRLSIAEIAASPRVALVMGPASYAVAASDGEQRRQAALIVDTDLSIAGCDIYQLPDRLRARLFDDRGVRQIDLRSGQFPALCFELNGGMPPLTYAGRYREVPVYSLEIPTAHRLAAANLSRSYFHRAPLVINESHSFGRWLGTIARECKSSSPRLERSQLDKFLLVLAECANPTYRRISTFNAFISAWRTSGLPEELYPPTVEAKAVWFGCDRVP